MEPDELRRTVLQLSQVKHALTKPEHLKVLKLSHAIRTFLRRRLEELAVSSHGPSMLVVMSDGWGASITKTIRLQFPGSHVATTRKGKFRHEFLLQRGLFRSTLLTGHTDLLFLLEEPIGLSKGKKAWNVYVGNQQWLPTLRQLGHKGITLSVYLADGALFTALERKYRARHLLHYRSGQDLGDNAWYLENADWVFCIKCKSHGCSNGCHWGLKTIGDNFVVDNCHITTASLVNGSTAIHQRVLPFVFRRIHFRTRAASIDDIEMFWKMLGAEPELIDDLAALDLDWSDNVLAVMLPRSGTL